MVNEQDNSVDWRELLAELLPLMGHRNFIVVADAAYPLGSNPGITTVCTCQGQLEVLKTVLERIAAAAHVRPVVHLDRELEFVPDADAPGADEYRARLAGVIEGMEVHRRPHEQIIAEVDERAEMFDILVLKTDMTIPYTSVFIELDCGYWSADKQDRLEKRLT